MSTKDVKFDTAVIVLGMHRSGTSAFTRALSLCGCDLPQTLLAASEVNERGFWESAKINQFNDEVFDWLGESWFSLGPIEDHLSLRPGYSKFKERATQLIADEFSGVRKPILKDPRICRLLGLWLDAFSNEAHNISFPIILRNPIEVSKSLIKRNDFDIELSLLLWARYYLDAEFLTRSKNRCFITYPSLLEDWQTTLNRVSDDLDLGLSISADASLEIASFLADSLRHQKVDDEAALLELTGSSLVLAPFQILFKWSQGAPPERADFERLDAARDSLGAMGSLLSGPFERMRLGRKRLTATKEKAATEETQLRQRARTLQLEVHAQRQTTRNLNASLNAVSNELQSIKRQFHSTRASLDKIHRDYSVVARKLEAAEAIINYYRSSIPGRIYDKYQRIRRKGIWLAKRLGKGASPSGRLQRIGIIGSSSLFDKDWYLISYPDVAATGIDPAVHYLEHGWREGRNPGPNFSTSAYLKAHADVAVAEINPLVHFLEHGQSEGRETVGFVSCPTTRTTEDFGLGAPCASFSIRQRSDARWVRRARLTSQVESIFALGNIPLGSPPEGPVAKDIADMFARFYCLSGMKLLKDEPRGRLKNSSSSNFILADCWFASYNLFRTRWHMSNGSAGFVVRALQRDPQKRDSVKFVGEAVIRTPTDIADFKLANPYFPLIFVFAEPSGKVISSAVLAFPSLSRGGLHYSELVQAATIQGTTVSQPIDIMGLTHELETKLLNLIGRQAKALISCIEVDLAGADGTQALFQPDLLIWLAEVMRLPVEAHTTPPEMLSSTGDYLRGVVKGIDMPTDDRQLRAAGRTRLRLPCDTVPTIGILTAYEDGENDIGREQNTGSLSMIVARHDPALPSLLLALPSLSGPGTLARAFGYPAAFPSMAPAITGGAPACAIRIRTERTLSESELLMPVAQLHTPTIKVGLLPSLTLLVCSDDWDNEELALSMEAFALQADADKIGLTLLGETAHQTARHFFDLFQGRVASHPNWATAVAGIDTELAAYVGSGVSLHDERTLPYLAGFLKDESIETASCVLLSSKKYGKSWSVTVSDGGEIPVSKDCMGALSMCPPLGQELLFWRSVYPIARPPRNFWMCRSSRLRQWTEGRTSTHDYHLCTSMITASCETNSAVTEPPFIPPAARKRHCLHTGMLQG